MKDRMADVKSALPKLNEAELLAVKRQLDRQAVKANLETKRVGNAKG